MLTDEHVATLRKASAVLCGAAYYDEARVINAILAAHSAGAQTDSTGSLAFDYAHKLLSARLGTHDDSTQTDAARDVLAEIITARKAMLKRIDDVHTADRQTGCNTFYDNDLERHTAILFRAIDAEIERLDRAKGE